MKARTVLLSAGKTTTSSINRSNRAHTPVFPYSFHSIINPLLSAAVKKMKTRFIFPVIIVSTFFAASVLSCKHKTLRTAHGKTASAWAAPSVQLWHPSPERICILFGYGYNSADFTAKMTEELEARYGSAENGGLILPLIFPDDFKRGGKSFSSEFGSLLDAEELRGIILLGAPDGTHKAIARLQDSFCGNVPYPVFSFFSQDDVLAMEDSADILIDKAQKAELDGVVETGTELTFAKEVPELLKNAADVIASSDAPFEKNAGLLALAERLAGGAKISRYIDTETGLVSVNHFVME